MISPGLELAQGFEYEVDELGIESSASVLAEIGHDLGSRQGVAKRPPVGHRIDHVGHGDEPCRDRNLVARQAVGIPRSVPPLAMPRQPGSEGR